MNERIVIDPEIQHGKPVIKGTRVPIARLIAELAGGMSFADVASEYGVTQEDIRAALAFAGDLIDSEEFHPLRKAS
jgi:uncharacterized protein (DUF433 family)